MFTAGKGDVLLSYENEAIAAQQAGEDIDYVIPDQTILIQNPIAVVNTGNAAEAQAFARLRPRSRRPEDLRRQRLPPGRPSRSRRSSTSRRRAAVRPSTDLGGWRRSRRSSSTRRRVDGRRSSQARGLPPSSSITARLPRAGPVTGAGRVGAPLGIGRRGALHERHRAHPVRRADRGAFDDGWDGFWNAITNEQAMTALKLTVGVSLVVVVINVVMGTIIAWVLVRDRFLGQDVRQLADRPALRPADDRRRRHAARALRARQPGRDQPRLHPRRHRASPCCW